MERRTRCGPPTGSNLFGGYKSESNLKYEEDTDAITLTHIEWLGSEQYNDKRITVDIEVRIIHPYSFYNCYMDLKIENQEKGYHFKGRFTHKQ